ncbi:HK97 family phage prohead protease [Castellaniella hirudinis]|uniref:HK97 family phage prohead protease n=1 Tax=Castellaniella hirudinis TaxID=1144617 RepID=UPI0039C2F92A
MQSLTCNLLELKFAPDEAGASTMSFSGYGAVFGNVDAGGDLIEPGAFSKFLADVKAGSQSWPAMLSQHGGWQMSAEDMTPIGVWTDLAEDGHGLKVEGQLADTPRGREMYTLMKMSPRPAIDGMSIGYIAKEWEPRTNADEPRRRLKRIDLIEISPVTRPMNGKARVSSVKGDFTERDFERLLTRDAGLSRSEAQIVINQGFKSLIAMRDAGSSELADLFEAVKRRDAAIPR